MKKVVLIIDSFKGCLTSREAEEAAKQGIQQIFPECEICCLPISDGGEGLLDVLLSINKGRLINITAHGPLMELREAQYGLSRENKTAFIEMAKISGLPLVSPEERNPMLTTTFGTGELIQDALNRGCRNFIIGIGGSATNDAGLGMLQALGLRLLNSQGNVLDIASGETLSEIANIDTDPMHPALKESSFTVACDVQNPFFGPQGAAMVFAPQKGATPQMIEQLDKGLQHIARLIEQKTGKDISNTPGAGAAGGMGGCMLAFLHAKLKPGIQLLLETIDFNHVITNADLIITGEGKADRQTLMGKVPYGVLKEAKKQDIPTALIAGIVEDKQLLASAGFKEVFSINPFGMSLEDAMQPDIARNNIQQTVRRICQKYS